MYLVFIVHLHMNIYLLTLQSGIIVTFNWNRIFTLVKHHEKLVNSISRVRFLNIMVNVDIA